MNIDMLHLLHQAFFGGIAAAGFGVLFNIGFRQIHLCIISGAFTLAVRTLGLDAGWSLEAASFVAALSTTTIATTAARNILGTNCSMMSVAGCIPMVPGAFFAQAILGMIALTAPQALSAEQTIVTSIQYGLRVFFTVAAIGAGIAIPLHLFKCRDFQPRKLT